MLNIPHELDQLSIPPERKEEYENWLKAEDAIEFLKKSTQHDEFIIYAAIGHVFMHAVLVPSELLKSPNIEDLMAWNFGPSSGWGVTSFSDKPSISISKPLCSTGSKILDQGEQLIFPRSFEGRQGYKNYFEVLQKFIHIFDLHFLEERNAYCWLDKNGDIEEVIKILYFNSKADGLNGTIITFKRSLVEEYAVLSKSKIVRMFDFTRFRRSGFAGWRTHDLTMIEHENLFFKSHIEPGHASYIRGVQIIAPSISEEVVKKRFFSYLEEENHQYASFIAYDWRHDIVREISCAPGETANYFIESDLPFEVSPAFFRPEVLIKYKTNYEKYDFQERSISCRGAWSLKTYDINEAGQVHTYIVYLRNLPYEEQLYWKSFNEKPKARISQRAVTTDFKGMFYKGYNPLQNIKNNLEKLNRQNVPWWRLKVENFANKVHYPVTSSPDEWANEILHLDQFIIEGFVDRSLKEKLKSLDRILDEKWGSLKLLEEYLIALNFEPDHAKKIIAPLREIHDLRSKIKGHVSSELVGIKKEILKAHSNYKKHFYQLCSNADESLQTVIQTLGTN